MSPPASFSGDWITPTHPDYPASIHRWAANAERKASIVAFIKSPQDAVLALKYAKQHSLPIAVRGGGHSAGGASSTEGGLVIDLSKYLNTAKVDPKKKLAYVGGGAVWATVDKAAIEHGLATVGGTVNHTGVGGLVLGGGYGFLTGEHGTALDNLVQVTIVVADGRVLTANSTENADLFWAVRGAGSNFGVVTEFVLQLHEQRRTVFAGIAMFPGAALDGITAILKRRWEEGLKEKEAIIHGLTRAPDGNPINLLILFWNGSQEEGRAHFKDFFDLGPFLDLCNEIPYETLNSLQNEGLPHGKNYYLKGVFTSSPIPEVAPTLLEKVVTSSATTSVSISLVYEYFPTKKFMSVPAHETSHVRGARVSCVVFAVWEKEGKQELDVVRKEVNELTNVLLHAEKKLDEKTNTGYGNYISEAPSTGSRADSSLLFGEHYPKLQKLKKEYDPELVFSKWCPIRI